MEAQKLGEFMQAGVVTRIDTTPSRASSVLAAHLRTVRDPQLQELPQIVARRILHCQGPLNIRASLQEYGS